MAVWHLTLDLKGIWRDESLTFGEKRDKVVARIKTSGWRALTPYPDHFDDLVAELEESLNSIEFEYAFDELYDLADSDRVRIETF
jgi:hypothetical protein